MTSCTISKKSVSGVYIFIDKRNPEINEAVHLYPYGKFNYRFSNSMSPEPIIPGDWKLIDNTVILNSSKTVTDSITGDKIKLLNIKYQIKANAIVRSIRNNGHLKLKKVRKRFKKFLLDGEVL
jgi:hypothetical protein